MEQERKHYNTSGTEVRSNRDVTQETLTERLELRLKRRQIPFLSPQNAYRETRVAPQNGRNLRVKSENVRKKRPSTGQMLTNAQLVRAKTFPHGQTCIFLILVDSIIEIITEKG